MGCKAEGAAQGFTLLGAVILVIYAINQIGSGLSDAIDGDFNAIVDVVLGVILIVLCLLSLAACGFVNWKVSRSGLLLAIFGLVCIFVVARGIEINITAWLQNAPLLAGFMILIAGILILVKD
jgi:hypothetical protein